MRGPQNYGYLRVPKGHDPADLEAMRETVTIPYANHGRAGNTLAGILEDIGGEPRAKLINRPQGSALNRSLRRGDSVFVHALSWGTPDDLAETVTLWRGRGVAVVLVGVKASAEAVVETVTLLRTIRRNADRDAAQRRKHRTRQKHLDRPPPKPRKVRRFGKESVPVGWTYAKGRLFLTEPSRVMLVAVVRMKRKGLKASVIRECLAEHGMIDDQGRQWDNQRVQRAMEENDTEPVAGRGPPTEKAHRFWLRQQERDARRRAKIEERKGESDV